MSVQRKASRCLAEVKHELIRPTERLYKKLSSMLSSNDIAIERNDASQPGWKKSHSFSQRFVPNEIQNYIRDRVDVMERISVKNGETRFTVELYMSHGNGRSRRDTERMQLLEALAITIGMSKWSLCGLDKSKVVIKMFDVDAPKEFSMDGHPITPSQVNSAYTIPCRFASGEKGNRALEVVVFRREEWKKVLFHELMHLYSYDIASNDKRINHRLSHIFHVKCDFNLTEAYAEFWARVLYVLWETHGEKRRFDTEIERQRKWSVSQGVVVLTSMGLTGNVLGARDTGNSTSAGQALPVCRETTAAFSYYVICGFMMTEWECVLAWCYEVNQFPLLFQGGFQYVGSFLTLLRELYAEQFVLAEWRSRLRKITSLTDFGGRVTARMTAG